MANPIYQVEISIKISDHQKYNIHQHSSESINLISQDINELSLINKKYKNNLYSLSRWDN